MADSKIVVFQDKQIRRAWMNEQWYFSIADVVEFLTDSVDVKQYIKRMRQRDPLLNRNWGTICTPVAMIAADGRRRSVQAADVKGLFRQIAPVMSRRISLYVAKIIRPNSSAKAATVRLPWIFSGTA